jgi:GTP-binding protein
VQDFETIMNELASFGAELDKKPMIVAASKIDVVNKDKLAKLKRYCTRKKLKLFQISAVTGAGIDDLKYSVGDLVKKMRERVRVPADDETPDSRIEDYQLATDSSSSTRKRRSRNAPTG